MIIPRSSANVNNVLDVIRPPWHIPLMEKPRLDIYPDAELVQALDRWRAKQPGLPSRAEAARELIRRGIAQDDAEKRGKGKC